MMKDYIILGSIFGLVIVMGLYFALAPKASQITYKPVDVGGGAIMVENQPNDLSTVTLDAELAAPGWITIHESMSGAPAAVIGTSTYMEPGVYEDFVITLTEEMDPGFRYITLLHVDNGDQVFEILDDLPVETNGEVVRPSFVAGKEPGDDSTIVDIPGTDESLLLEPVEEEASEDETPEDE